MFALLVGAGSWTFPVVIAVALALVLVIVSTALFFRNGRSNWINLLVMAATWFGAIGAVSGIYLIQLEIRNLNENIDSQAYNDINDNLDRLDELFITYPEVRPYFYDRKPMPTDEPLESRVRAVAEAKLDFLDFYFTQVRHVYLPEYDNPEWLKYFENGFRHSPALCRVLADEYDEYGDELRVVAQAGCPGIKPFDPAAVKWVDKYFPKRTVRLPN